MSLLGAQAQAVSQPSRHGAVWSGTRGLMYLDSNTLCIPRPNKGDPLENHTLVIQASNYCSRFNRAGLWEFGWG